MRNKAIAICNTCHEEVRIGRKLVRIHLEMRSGREDKMKKTRKISRVGISLPEEFYSSASDSQLQRMGFETSGAGCGSYEYEIEGKTRREAKAIVNKIFTKGTPIAFYKA